MRKLLRVGTALAVVMAAGSSYAESQWKQSGSMRYRTEQKDNNGFGGGRLDYTGMQFKWDLTFQPNDMTTIFFQPKMSVNAGATAQLAADPAVGAHQAYFMHKFADSFAFTAGRMELKYGDELVIGPVGWHGTGRSFDGVKGRYSMDNVWVDVLAMKITESLVTPSTDVDFGGLYFNYSGAPIVSAIDLYYLMRATTGTDDSTQNSLNAMGMRLAGNTAGVDFRLEYTTESGKRPATAPDMATDREKASQYDVEVGYTLPGDFKARFSVETLSAGEGYDQLYPTGHKWLGYADLLSRRNITGFVGHVMVPVNDFKIGFDYHMYSRLNTDESAYDFTGAAFGTGSTEAAIGSEMDLTVHYAFGPAFDGLLGYSTVTPGAYLKDLLPDDKEGAMNFLYVQLTAKF